MVKRDIDRAFLFKSLFIQVILVEIKPLLQVHFAFWGNIGKTWAEREPQPLWICHRQASSFVWLNYICSYDERNETNLSCCWMMLPRLMMWPPGQPLKRQIQIMSVRDLTQWIGPHVLSVLNCVDSDCREFVQSQCVLC